MPIPSPYHFMRPMLELLKDGKIHQLKQLEVDLASCFKLTQPECDELLPSGRATRVYDRVQWAVTYLRQAKLIESVGRGNSRITQQGAKYLETAPDPIKRSDLMQFPEFVAFIQRGRSPSQKIQDTVVSVTSATSSTPEEIINAAYNELRDALAQEILERIKTMPPAFFEQLIVQLMLKLGYGGTSTDAGQTLGKSGDGGVDGVINQDKLGLDKIYLQAKRWGDTPVGSKEIQAFVGALVGQGASKGVFITTSTFTDAATKQKDKNPGFKISLINGLELARLMIDYDLGVSLVQRFELKRIDSDFFSEN